MTIIYAVKLMLINGENIEFSFKYYWRLIGKGEVYEFAPQVLVLKKYGFAEDVL